MEEISNLNIAITTVDAGGSENIGRIAYLARTIGSCQGREQIVGTTPEPLLIVSSVPTFIYMHNLGSTAVTVDAVITMDAFPQRVMPGENLCLSPETDMIYVKSSDSNGKIWVMSVY